jgi:hypothetical protein
MGKSRKGGLLGRRKSALALLEARYEEFKAAKEDKAPWTTTRNGRIHKHAGRTYAQECKRLAGEIETLKAKISRGSLKS